MELGKYYILTKFHLKRNLFRPTVGGYTGGKAAQGCPPLGAHFPLHAMAKWQSLIE